MRNGSWLVRDPIWPARVVACGVSQYAQLVDDRAELRGRQSTRTTARAGGRNAGTVSRDRSALQRLGLMLRFTVRGRNGGTTIYRPSPAGAPPRLAAHRRTMARILGTPALLEDVAPASPSPPPSPPPAPPPPLELLEDAMAPRLTFAQRMAAAGLDFGAIGVEVPEGVTLPLIRPELEPVAAPATGPSATVSCQDYRAHQSSHRRTPAGWACGVCAP